MNSNNRAQSDGNEWKILRNEVVQLWMAGDFNGALVVAQKALVLAEKTVGPDPDDVATSLDDLSKLNYTLGDYAKVDLLKERYLAIMEKVHGLDRPIDVAERLNSLAFYYHVFREDSAKAESTYRRAIALWEKAFGPDCPLLTNSLNPLADLYVKQGEYAKAEPLMKRALAIVENEHGVDHERVIYCLHNLANLYKVGEDYTEAERLYRRALVIGENAQGSGPLVRSLEALAGFYLIQGDYAKAEPLLKRVMATLERYGPDHPVFASALDNLAGLYRATERDSEAEALEQRTAKNREIER